MSVLGIKRMGHNADALLDVLTDLPDKKSHVKSIIFNFGDTPFNHRSMDVDKIVKAICFAAEDLEREGSSLLFVLAGESIFEKTKDCAGKGAVT